MLQYVNTVHCSLNSPLCCHLLHAMTFLKIGCAVFVSLYQQFSATFIVIITINIFLMQTLEKKWMDIFRMWRNWCWRKNILLPKSGAGCSNHMKPILRTLKRSFHWIYLRSILWTTVSSWKETLDERCLKHNHICHNFYTSIFEGLKFYT